MRRNGGISVLKPSTIQDATIQEKQWIMCSGTTCLTFSVVDVTSRYELALDAVFCCRIQYSMCSATMLWVNHLWLHQCLGQMGPYLLRRNVEKKIWITSCVHLDSMMNRIIMGSEKRPLHLWGFMAFKLHLFPCFYTTPN